MRPFTMLRKMLVTHQDHLNKFKQLETKFSNYEDPFLLVFEYLKQFEETKEQLLDKQNLKQTG